MRGLYDPCEVTAAGWRSVARKRRESVVLQDRVQDRTTGAVGVRVRGLVGAELCDGVFRNHDAHRREFARDFFDGPHRLPDVRAVAHATELEQRRALVVRVRPLFDLSKV